ncbi:MAG: hypothetical protein II852_01685 [Bacteroidales bacterium]|nr:hypothetical protein [Bacteroidales bacterium]
MANALVNIYQKKYGNGRELEPTLFEKTKEILGGAVNKGWNAGGSPATDRNSAFIDALRHNADVFSAFRTHKMQSDIAAQLLDSKGRLKPFGQFVKDVKPYVTHQNRAWLQTEYDTAVLRAHQAADWKQFEAEKDVLPNLEWLPSTSPHPGEDHRPYWGTVLPIDHKFWNDHRPGDRWNCKCRLRNTDKEPTAAPAETLVKNLKPSKGLESNPGKTGEIFSNKHPYYPENCGKCPFNKGVGRLFANLIKTGKDCSKCRLLNDCINRANECIWDARAAQRNKVISSMDAGLNNKKVDQNGNGHPIKIGFKHYGNKHLYNDVAFKIKEITPNDLLYIDEILEKAVFVTKHGSSKNRKDDIKRFYYYKTIINGKVFYLNVAETDIVKGNGTIRHERYLYAITEKLRE